MSRRCRRNGKQCRPWSDCSLRIKHPSGSVWALSNEFVSSSIPSWQIFTAHAQPFRGARDMAFCLKLPLDSLLVSASSEGSGETARMRRLAWTFAARIGYKYQICVTRSSLIWVCTVCQTYLSENLRVIIVLEMLHSLCCKQVIGYITVNHSWLPMLYWPHKCSTHACNKHTQFVCMELYGPVSTV